MKLDYTPNNGNYYTVINGDTLYNISQKFGITVDELKNANKLENNLLTVGQILIIPSKDTTKNQNTYTVTPGDTLYNIAKRFNIPVDKIKQFNNLTTNTLSIGQVLKLPNQEKTNDIYTVVNGDSLYSIAKKLGTSVDKIKEINNLSSNLLSIGQKIKIPANSIDEDNNYINYTVEKGDNLYTIARKYNITQDKLMELNNLSSNLLSIGQILIIPTNNQELYTVISGDTLYNIARKFNTTTADIIKKNNLNDNTVKVGQKLII